MRGKIQDILALIKTVLCTVAMVYVEVDYHNPLNPECLYSLPCSNSHVVEEAETHGLRRCCMVTRRSDAGKTRIDLAFKRQINQLYERSYCTDRNLVGIFGAYGVRIKINVPICNTRTLYSIDMEALVAQTTSKGNRDRRINKLTILVRDLFRYAVMLPLG